MGKAARVVVPLAAVGAGLWMAWPTAAPTLSPGAVGFGTTVHAPTSFLSSAGSWFSNIGSTIATKVSRNPLTSLVAGAGFVTNILAGESRVSDIGLQMQMEERRMRMARVQAFQQEAMALKQASGARGAAIAKAVAQNQSITGRSFLAFMDEREEETRQHIDTIRVNAEAGLTTSQMRLSQFGKQKSGARLEAAGGAARSLLAVV